MAAEVHTRSHARSGSFFFSLTLRVLYFVEGSMVFKLLKGRLEKLFREVKCGSKCSINRLKKVAKVTSMLRDVLKLSLFGRCLRGEDLFLDEISRDQLSDAPLKCRNLTL